MQDYWHHNPDDSIWHHKKNKKKQHHIFGTDSLTTLSEHHCSPPPQFIWYELIFLNLWSHCNFWESFGVIVTLLFLGDHLVRFTTPLISSPLNTLETTSLIYQYFNKAVCKCLHKPNRTNIFLWICKHSGMLIYFLFNCVSWSPINCTFLTQLFCISWLPQNSLTAEHKMNGDGKAWQTEM